MAKIYSQITMTPIGDLVAHLRNARTHSAEQLDQIARSIETFGFTNPILADEAGFIIAGHGRWLAACALGLTEVPVITLTGLTEDQRRAYLIADNKIALNAGWDEAMLAAELAYLSTLEGIDLSVTGFSDDEVEGIVDEFFAGASLSPQSSEGEDEVPEPPKTPVSKLGDIWLLGAHRLMCGDSTDGNSMGILMGAESAQMVFTDPPYNVNYGANKNPRHKIRTIANDSMSDGDWDTFVREYMASILRFCEGNIYIAMSDKELGHMQRVFLEMGGKWSSFIVWVKDRFVLSPKDYHSRHETILYGWRDGVKGRQRVEDRTQDDVWEIKRPTNSEEHPTMKPVELIERALVNSSKELDIVLDVFGGSGSTLIACQKLNRVCRMMELDPQYVDVIVERWQKYTGLKAENQHGQHFDTLRNNQ